MSSFRSTLKGNDIKNWWLVDRDLYRTKGTNRQESVVGYSCDQPNSEFSHLDKRLLCLPRQRVRF